MNLPRNAPGSDSEELRLAPIARPTGSPRTRENPCEQDQRCRPRLANSRGEGAGAQLRADFPLSLREGLAPVASACFEMLAGNAPSSSTIDALLFPAYRSVRQSAGPRWVFGDLVQLVGEALKQRCGNSPARRGRWAETNSAVAPGPAECRTHHHQCFLARLRGLGRQVPVCLGKYRRSRAELFGNDVRAGRPGSPVQSPKHTTRAEHGQYADRRGADHRVSPGNPTGRARRGRPAPRLPQTFFRLDDRYREEGRRRSSRKSSRRRNSSPEWFMARISSSPTGTAEVCFLLQIPRASNGGKGHQRDPRAGQAEQPEWLSF